MRVELSVITVNYNGLEDTCALIDSIPSDDKTEVIVVDNGSDSDEAALISSRYPHVKTIRSRQNLGFAGGNNIGIKAARGQFLYLINNDTVFNGFDVQPLIDRLASSPRIAVVCPKIRFARSERHIQFAGFTPLTPITLRNHAIGYGEEDRGQYDAPHPTPYAHGAAMMVSREAIGEVGLIPECYFLYYEEMDWSAMFTRAGYEIWYEPGSTIYHKDSQTTGTGSPLKTYYMTRNRLLFASRNSSGARRLATFCYLMLTVGPRDVARHLLNRHPRQAKATLRGLYDFCRKKQGQLI